MKLSGTTMFRVAFPSCPRSPWARVSTKFCFAFLILLFLPCLAIAEEPYDPDLEFLKESKVATDGPGLLKYLQQRSGHDDDLLHLEELIRQLGSPDFQARQQAVQKLIAVGPPAHARLLEVQKDQDKERARGAKQA